MMIKRFIHLIAAFVALFVGAGLVSTAAVLSPSDAGKFNPNRATRRRNAEAAVSLRKRRRWFADGVMIKEGWANALEPGIREWFFLGAQRRPSLISTMFNVMSSQKDAEYMVGIGAIPPDAWNDFSKSGRVPSVSFDQGYKSTFRHTTYLVELPIQQELIEDNLYGQIIDAAQSLGDSAQLKRETDAASIFVNAFTSTYTGPDGVSLCNDSHPGSPENTGYTQDNNFALSLTRDNVKTVREAMQGFKDDKGNLLAVTPDTLLVPPGLEDDALVIAQSVLDPTSANNAINPQRGRFKVVTWHYLTDTNAWFMLDSVLMKRSLIWFDRVPMDVVLDRVEQRAYAYYNARMRYSYGWRDWCFVAGSNPS